jgi:hypothetical protein
MVTLPSWWHSGKMITEISDMPENTYGFIYEVTHKPTDRKYLGKKVLFFERNVRIGKREAEALKEERKAKGIGGRVPAKKKVIKESDWKDYYGSHKDIVKLIKEEKQFEFERRILIFVPNKKLLTYYECKYLFINEVLEPENNYINDNILGKFYKKDFKDDKN